MPARVGELYSTVSGSPFSAAIAGTPPAPPGYHLLLAGVMTAAAVDGVTVVMTALVAGLRTLSMYSWPRM